MDEIQMPRKIPRRSEMCPTCLSLRRTPPTWLTTEGFHDWCSANAITPIRILPISLMTAGWATVSGTSDDL